MPYASHLRVTASGMFGSATVDSGERWSWGFQVGNPDGSATDLGLAGARENMRTAIKNFHQNPDANIAPVARLTRIVIALIQPDGHVAVDPATGAFVQDVSDFAAVPGGGSTSAPLHPFQVAQCVSLLTERADRHGKGRFYLPGPLATPGADGLISTATQANVLGAAQEFVTDLNAAAGPTVRIVVASRAGTNAPVTAVRVGRVLDTQRRRRRGLDEHYAIASV